MPHRSPIAITVAALILAGAGCATPTLDLPTPAALADLASRNSLRVALLTSNPVQAVKDSKGELKGPAIDLARSLANRLGVPLETTGYARAEDIVAKSGTWDVAFLPLDAARANDVDFSHPYLESQNTRQAIALPKGKTAGLAYVNQFIEQAKTSGYVERSIERAGLKGATVTPAGSR